MRLSIIVPAYNEESTVQSVISEIYSVSFPQFIDSVEVIAVNDFSSDKTLENLKLAQKHFSGLIIISNQKNLGKGASVRNGFERATGDVLFVQDADLELTPHDIPRMLEAMNELNVEFVNGSRYMPGVLRPLASYRRYLANRLFTFFVSVLIDVKLTDMACGHKLIHRNLLNQITLKENRFGFEAELILKALKIKKNNIVEMPVRFTPRQVHEGKKLGTLDAFKILITIIRYGVF
jgi:glycosyltransferase involved in cell wall biosynthesis